MANDDGDGGVHESVTANMRAVAMLAMQVGERLAKTWAELAREAQQRAMTESRLLEARLEAERTAAVATLAVVDRPEWWAAANEQQVAQVLETAATWSDQDPGAARAMDTIDREVRDRYGVALETLQQRARTGQEGVETAEALAAADILDRAAEDQQARGERDEAISSGGTTEAAATHQLEQEAAARGAAVAGAAREPGEIAYDSAERREAFAVALGQSTELDLVAGRARSDANFAYPAERALSVRGATSVTHGRPSAAPDRSRHRPGRTR